MALTLKAWRRAKGLSQAKMAEELKVHVNTYINWENEPNKISIGNAIKICDVLKESFDDVIFLPDNATEV